MRGISEQRRLYRISELCRPSPLPTIVATTSYFSRLATGTEFFRVKHTLISLYQVNCLCYRIYDGTKLQSMVLYASYFSYGFPIAE